MLFQTRNTVNCKMYFTFRASLTAGAKLRANCTLNVLLNAYQIQLRMNFMPAPARHAFWRASRVSLSDWLASVRSCRWCLTSDNCWGFTNQTIILKCSHHEESIIHTACNVALKNWIANVFAPYRQSLALAFF